MAAVVAMQSESGSDNGYDKARMDLGKYVRYTPEQVEVLERVYAECPKPSSRSGFRTEGSAFKYNCRCRDKQRKKASRFKEVNRKLTAMDMLLMEENEHL